MPLTEKLSKGIVIDACTKVHCGEGRGACVCGYILS